MKIDVWRVAYYKPWVKWHINLFYRDFWGYRKHDTSPARQWQLPNQDRKRIQQITHIIPSESHPCPCPPFMQGTLWQASRCSSSARAENTGKVCLELYCLQGILIGFVKGHLLLHMQNLSLSSVGAIALAEHVKRKILKLFSDPHCCRCWNTAITYHYLGNYDVRCHTSTIQMKRRKGEEVGGKAKEKGTRWGRISWKT